MQATVTPSEAVGALRQKRHAALGATGLIKRAFDLAVTLAGGLCILPFLLLVAVLIKLDSPGSVLYKQQRNGLDGELFWMYKFRSMHVGAEAIQADMLALNEMSGPLFKMRHDPRVTRFGKFIRKCSLDEFPQLINVLRGEMSLVGPRPPLPTETAAFEPWHHEKFVVRPGMTGLWQVSGRNQMADFDQMIALDLRYVRGWSLFADLRILLKTVVVVLRCAGAF